MIRVLALAVTTAAMIATASAETPKADPAKTDPAAVAKARDEVWALEQSIYKGRAKAGLAFYLEHASRNYVGWPPQAPQPLDFGGLTESGKELPANNKEQLSMTLNAFTLEGDTGVIYYSTHRTVRPDGTPVDEHFEVIHVWLHDHGTWKIFGAMARAEPKRG